jgi:hypothetical protein
MRRRTTRMLLLSIFVYSVMFPAVCCYKYLSPRLYIDWRRQSVNTDYSQMENFDIEDIPSFAMNNEPPTIALYARKYRTGDWRPIRNIQGDACVMNVLQSQKKDPESKEDTYSILDDWLVRNVVKPIGELGLVAQAKGNIPQLKTVHSKDLEFGYAISSSVDSEDSPIRSILCEGLSKQRQIKENANILRVKGGKHAIDSDVISGETSQYTTDSTASRSGHKVPLTESRGSLDSTISQVREFLLKEKAHTCDISCVPHFESDAQYIPKPRHVNARKLSRWEAKLKNIKQIISYRKQELINRQLLSRGSTTTDKPNARVTQLDKGASAVDQIYSNMIGLRVTAINNDQNVSHVFNFSVTELFSMSLSTLSPAIEGMQRHKDILDRIYLQSADDTEPSMIILLKTQATGLVAALTVMRLLNSGDSRNQGGVDSVHVSDSGSQLRSNTFHPLKFILSGLSKARRDIILKDYDAHKDSGMLST